MILDIHKFIKREQHLWKELEQFLDGMDNKSMPLLSLEQVRRVNYLYSKVSEDLTRISTFTGEDEIRKYLQALVARAYSTIHTREKRSTSMGFKKIISMVFKWFFVEFPAAFRRNIGIFTITVLITVFGFIFGGVAVSIDKDAKEAIFPKQFSHLYQSPGERIEQAEKSDVKDRLAGRHSLFAATLMTNNIRVAINALVLGITWGIGTVIILFYNGIILGAVSMDYILSGNSVFLLGWLLPHGVIEIPAILIAGQAGLILGNSLLKATERSRRSRLREKMTDIATLIGGVAILLIWAGIIESFLSQYHEPVIPYVWKITFGMIEFILLIIFLMVPFRKSK